MVHCQKLVLIHPDHSGWRRFVSVAATGASMTRVSTRKAREAFPRTRHQAEMFSERIPLWAETQACAGTDVRLATRYFEAWR